MRSQHLIELHTISTMQCIAGDTLSYPVKVAAGMGNHPAKCFWVMTMLGQIFSRLSVAGLI